MISKRLEYSEQGYRKKSISRGDQSFHQFFKNKVMENMNKVANKFNFFCVMVAPIIANFIMGKWRFSRVEEIKNKK